MDLAPKKKKNTTMGVSFPDEELLNAAKRRADRLQMSLSAYVCTLLQEDLKNTREFVIRDDETPYRTKTNP